MPPKAKAAKGAKKAGGKKGNEKQKQKIVEDKTFGLKNKKKSAKVQKYVQTVQKQVDHQLGQPKKSKKDKSELDEFIAYKPAVEQAKLEKGVDPKSLVCQYFKQGKCNRGNKCRYSHDLEVERKAAKIDLYTDARREDEENMDEWDQEKLEDVVRKKHSATNSNKTDIVCKYFLDAVENRKYGWFWECPNGLTCKYRHALPPGYILKKDRVKEEVSTMDVVEEIEEERKKLETHTPITQERFMEWKRKKAEEKDAADAAKAKQRKADIKSGAAMRGREIFEANPELFVDDDLAADSKDITVAEEEMDPSVPVNIITATGTSITRTAVTKPKAETPKEEPVVMDESLFGEEDLDDLDDLE